MAKNRIIYFTFLILSLIFITYYGGALPYICALTLLFLPVISFIYILVVYKGFRIYQDIPTRNAVKDQSIAYELCLANVLPVSIGRIRLYFSDRLSYVQDYSGSKDYTLAPYDKLVKSSHVVCKYRGTYTVGVDFIEIWDLFGIMKIKFKNPMKTRLIVSPNIKSLSSDDKLAIEMDMKQNSRYSSKNISLLSGETRKYLTGDSIRSIHWKNSARSGELIVRKEEFDERETIVMDSSYYDADYETQIEQYDDLIERTLSLLDYNISRSKSVYLSYFPEEKYSCICVSSYSELCKLCEGFAEYRFSKKYSIENAVKLVEEIACDASVITITYQDIDKE